MTLNLKKLPKFEELQLIEPKYNWYILLFFAIWFVSAYLTLQIRNFWLQIPGYLLAGAALTSLGLLMHEAVHFKLFNNHGLNRWMGFLCGLPNLVGMSAYKSIHWQHHRYERGVKDPEEFENITQRPPLLKLILLGWFLVGAYFYGLLHIPFTGLKLASRAEKIKIIQEYVILGLILGSAFILLPFGFLAQVFLLPLAVTAQLTQVRGLAEHIFTAGDSPLTATRTITSNRFVRFFMCNMNYHLEHHLYPSVPWYNVSKLHYELRDDLSRAGASFYSSYLRYLKNVLVVLFTKVSIPKVRPKPDSGYYQHLMPVLAPGAEFGTEIDIEPSLENRG